MPTSFKRILAVADPTAEAQPAVERAAWLAGKTGARLELLICYYNEYLSGNRLFDAESLREAREEVLGRFETELEQRAEMFRRDGIPVNTTVLWHHPVHEGMVEHAKSSGADIVFKDTHHHSAIERALFTSSDWALIRTCPVPLWLVKPVELPEKPVFLGAVDPFHEHDKPAALDDEILALGKQLSEYAGGELHAFHSYDPRVAVATATANAYIPVSLPLDEIEKEMRVQHGKRFREVAEFHGLSEDKMHLISGLTHEELPAKARELEASVVVMGAVARNRLRRLFIGATAERTLEHLPCDLLIVKPGWMTGKRDAEEA